MQSKIITLPYSATLGGFDDEPLTSFINRRILLSFREHFFCVNDIPHLACVLTYRESPVPQATDEAIKKERKKSKPSTSEIAKGLPEDDRAVFSTLRAWRASEAEKEGVPPYIILTNRELIAIVTKRPESLGALGNIEGIGKKKLEKWGAPIVELVKKHAFMSADEETKG